MIDTHTRFFEKKKESIKNVPANNITVQKPAHNCRCKWQEKMSEIKGGRDACEGSPSDLYAEEKRFSKGSLAFTVPMNAGEAMPLNSPGWSALHVQCVYHVWIACGSRVCVAILDWCTRLPVRGLPIRRSVYSFCAHKTIGAGQLGRTTEALVACKLSSL